MSQHFDPFSDAPISPEGGAVKASSSTPADAAEIDAYFSSDAAPPPPTAAAGEAAEAKDGGAARSPSIDDLELDDVAVDGAEEEEDDVAAEEAAEELNLDEVEGDAEEGAAGQTAPTPADTDRAAKEKEGTPTAVVAEGDGEEKSSVSNLWTRFRWGEKKAEDSSDGAKKGTKKPLSPSDDDGDDGEVVENPLAAASPKAASPKTAASTLNSPDSTLRGVGGEQLVSNESLAMAPIPSLNRAPSMAVLGDHHEVAGAALNNSSIISGGFTRSATDSFANGHSAPAAAAAAASAASVSAATAAFFTSSPLVTLPKHILAMRPRGASLKRRKPATSSSADDIATAAADGNASDSFTSPSSALSPPHQQQGGSITSISDLPPIHNLPKLIPCQMINAVSEVLEKDFPPPLKKNAVIPTALPSEMLMPITLRCDFCQKFDSICSNCNKKWTGIVESRRAVLMNNIKPMQHLRKMSIYFGTILYGSTDFLQALIVSQSQLKNWCSKLGPTLVPKGQPAEVQMKVADEKGRLFGLHVAMAFGKLTAAKTLLESGAALRRCDSKKYPTEFLPSPIPDDWDDMLQLQQPYIEFRMAERARNLRRDHDYESASLEYSALLSLNPNNEHAHCGIAKMLFDQEKYEECLAQCKCILAIEAAAANAKGGAVAGPSAASPSSSSADKDKRASSKAAPPSTVTSPAKEAKEPSVETAAAADGSADADGGADAADRSSGSSSPLPSSQPPVIASSSDVVVVGGIHWAEFGLTTIQELTRHANAKFHEVCHSEPTGPALKKCGCVVTDRTVVRLRSLPYKLMLQIVSYCDCSMLWGWWRAVRMPLLRTVLERSGAVLCDNSIGEMLSQENNYSKMYEKIAADKPSDGAELQKKNATLWMPLRFVGLQVKAMADFNTFVIKSAVAGTNPNYREPDTSVFFPKARKPMEKLRRVVAVKEFFVHRREVGGDWNISSAGEWEVDEQASITLQIDIQRKIEADEKAKAAAAAGGVGSLRK